MCYILKQDRGAMCQKYQSMLISAERCDCERGSRRKGLSAGSFLGNSE
ncbi:MAG: hypothetical protein IKV81_01300 [Clostridia bacterium]|nr:hypothetical protein [Clostridia bacterium]